MYNSNTDSLGLILGVEVFFSLGHCSGALCKIITMTYNTGALRHFPDFSASKNRLISSLN